MGKVLLKPWYADPTKLIPLGVGTLTFFGAVVGFFVKTARTEDRVELLDARLDETESQVADQSEEFQQANVQQQLIQKDVEYIKQQSNQILEAIKSRR